MVEMVEDVRNIIIPQELKDKRNAIMDEIVELDAKLAKDREFWEETLEFERKFSTLKPIDYFQQYGPGPLCWPEKSNK